MLLLVWKKENFTLQKEGVLFGFFTPTRRKTNLLTGRITDSADGHAQLVPGRSFSGVTPRLRPSSVMKSLKRGKFMAPKMPPNPIAGHHRGVRLPVHRWTVIAILGSQVAAGRSC